MKYFLLSVSLFLQANNKTTLICVGSQTVRNEPLAMVLIKADLLNDDQESAVATLVQDMVWTEQFRVIRGEEHGVPSAAQLAAYASKNTPLALVVSHGKHGGLAWRLLDTQTTAMLAGKEASIKDPLLWGHRAAQILWKELTGIERAYTAPLVYCEYGGSPRKPITVLCMSDLFGNGVTQIVTMRRHAVAPVWGVDSARPEIFYSEFTPTAVRLCATDLAGQRRVVLDRDGTLVGVSFMPQEPAGSKTIVYCLSGQLWRFVFDEGAQYGRHEKLSKLHDVCASPTVLSNGDIIFCSNGMIKRYSGWTGVVTPVFQSAGSCVAPAVNPVTGDIVFSRRTQGHMHLWVFNPQSGESYQLTHGKGDVSEPSWAPCGTMLAFHYREKGKDRVGIVDIATGSTIFVTPVSRQSAYPTWGPAR